MIKTFAYLLVLVSLLHSYSCHASSKENLVSQSMRVHGLEKFWNKQWVQAEVNITFGDNPIVDASFLFQAHGSKSMMINKDTSRVIYLDKNNCYQVPADILGSKGRFHVWTWPWFIIAPFKMAGDGIQLGSFKKLNLQGKTYHTFLQSFDKNEGDAPDDWYRLFIDPESKILDAMAYVVTFGKSVEEASKKPSIILYKKYQTVEGMLFSMEYEFWYWNEETGLEGETPKGSGTISNIEFPSEAHPLFKIPGDSRKIELPDT